jgi:hypothetical protein
MKLTLDTVLPYLVDHGLVDVAEIVDQQVSVTDASRRNCNFKVRRDNGDGYLIKQAADGALDAERTLACEAAFYRFCAEDARGEALRRVVPHLRAHVPEEALLITRFIDGAEPLWQHCEARGQGVPAEIGALLGRALAVLHTSCRAGELAADPRLAGLPRHPPWILFAHKPGPEILGTLSGAGLQTLRILQSEGELRRHLDELRRDARCEALVHGDVKSDNVLVFHEGGETRIALVDWELVHFGDPAWDVGGAFFDLLRLWISSMPLTPGTSPADLMAWARVPLDRVQPAMRAFWSAYRVVSGLAPGEAPGFLARAARFCAARLVQGAYEHAQDASTLANAGVMMLQVAAHVFARPEAAARHLFDLPA